MKATSSQKSRQVVAKSRKSHRTTRVQQQLKYRKTVSRKLPAAKPLGIPSTSREVSHPVSNKLNIWAINLPTEQRRPIVLDAESICYNDITETYQAWRIQPAISWAEGIGHRVTVMASNYMLDKLDDRSIMADIEARGILEWLPASDASNSYSMNPNLENRLLARARELDAAIVSERSFSGANSEFMPMILERVIGFCFFRQQIFIPVDPYGRSGPKLREILTKLS